MTPVARWVVLLWFCGVCAVACHAARDIALATAPPHQTPTVNRRLSSDALSNDSFSRSDASSSATVANAPGPNAAALTGTVASDTSPLLAPPSALAVIGAPAQEGLMARNCTMPSVPDVNFTSTIVAVMVSDMRRRPNEDCYSVASAVLAICLPDLSLARGCCNNDCAQNLRMVSRNTWM